MNAAKPYPVPLAHLGLAGRRIAPPSRGGMETRQGTHDTLAPHSLEFHSSYEVSDGTSTGVFLVCFTSQLLAPVWSLELVVAFSLSEVTK